MSQKLLLKTLKLNEKCSISFIYVQILQFYVLKKFFSPTSHFLMQKRRNIKISKYSVTSLIN